MRKEVADRYYNRPRVEMLPLVPSAARRVLDIGCANGEFSASIKERQGSEIWGVELNPEAAAVAASRLDKVIQGDIYDAMGQLPANYFDCVVCNDILEHLPDPGRILEGIRKNLSPDGVVVASIPNVRYLPVLYELLVTKDWKYRDCGVLDNTHLRFFTCKSIFRLFESSGYRIVRIEGLQVPAPAWYSLAFLAVNILTFGYYNDSRYIQFGCLAEQRRG